MSVAVREELNRLQNLNEIRKIHRRTANPVVSTCCARRMAEEDEKSMKEIARVDAFVCPDCSSVWARSWRREQ